MTIVWSSDEPWDDYDAGLYDEDDYGCLDPDSCGDPCMGECYGPY